MMNLSQNYYSQKAMKLWKKIKTSLFAVACNEDNLGIREDWQSHYFNNVERRERRIRESHR